MKKTVEYLISDKILDIDPEVSFSSKPSALFKPYLMVDVVLNRITRRQVLNDHSGVITDYLTEML